jgi:hypothetical protein
MRVAFCPHPLHFCTKCHPYITNTSLCADHVGKHVAHFIPGLCNSTSQCLRSFCVTTRDDIEAREDASINPTTSTSSFMFHVLGGTLNINVS